MAEKQKSAVWIDRDIHSDLRIYSIKNERSVRDIVTQLIVNFLAEEDSKNSTDILYTTSLGGGADDRQKSEA